MSKDIDLTKLKLNTALMTDFSPGEMEFFKSHGETIPGQIDREVKQSGEQSLRAAERVELKLGHIPAHSHRLALWLRADKPTRVGVNVRASAPAMWQFRIVDILRRQYPDSPQVAFEEIKPPVYSTEAQVETAWKEFTLDCPYDGTPIEGYTLSLVQNGAGATYWVDSISFTPQWQ
jgi:hypothetical protein